MRELIAVALYFADGCRHDSIDAICCDLLRRIFELTLMALSWKWILVNCEGGKTNQLVRKLMTGGLILALGVDVKETEQGDSLILSRAMCWGAHQKTIACHAL